jgi:hypothetical protein
VKEEGTAATADTAAGKQVSMSKLPTAAAAAAAAAADRKDDAGGGCSGGGDGLEESATSIAAGRVKSKSP